MVRCKCLQSDAPILRRKYHIYFFYFDVVSVIYLQFYFRSFHLNKMSVSRFSTRSHYVCKCKSVHFQFHVLFFITVNKPTLDQDTYTNISKLCTAFTNCFAINKQRHHETIHDALENKKIFLSFSFFSPIFQMPSHVSCIIFSAVHFIILLMK